MALASVAVAFGLRLADGVNTTNPPHTKTSYVVVLVIPVSLQLNS